jgi:hypothetical protein
MAIGLVSCDQLDPSTELTLSARERSGLAAQIKTELEDDRCSALFVIEHVRITDARLMSGGGDEPVLEARGVAALRQGSQQDSGTMGCNTLVLRRRIEAMRGAPSGALDVPVRAYFSQASPNWLLEAADFDD